MLPWCRCLMTKPMCTTASDRRSQRLPPPSRRQPPLHLRPAVSGCGLGTGLAFWDIFCFSEDQT